MRNAAWATQTRQSSCYEGLRPTFTKELGAGHPERLNSMNCLGSAYQNAGELDRALALYAETLAICKSNLGPDDPGTLITMNNLALAYRSAGKRDLALPLLEETLAMFKSRSAPPIRAH